MEDAVKIHSRGMNSMGIYTDLEVLSVVADLSQELYDVNRCINIITKKYEHRNDMSSEDIHKVIVLRDHINKLLTWFTNEEVQDIFEEFLYE